MTNITSILARQRVEISNEEMLEVIGAALGVAIEIDHYGGWSFASPTDNQTQVGAMFEACFSGRRFGSLLAIAACVIDLQLEQLDLAGIPT